VEVHPRFAPAVTALGIDTAAGLLDLPGEVVSGHPDRHVVRVQLPGIASPFYLKRQHTVTRRERLRNRMAGFGWSARCVREAAILKQLDAAGLPCPQWAAFGEDGRGRAFLLVEEVSDATDLRTALSDTGLSPSERRELAEHLGRLVALLHAGGITTPDLTAKHVLVSPAGITLIDWQSARRLPLVPLAERVRALATLHASLADELATPRERLRVLRRALAPAREAGIIRARFSDLARHVEREAETLRDRRSIRDQRQPAVTGAAQRLVWVAGEAVCAVPDVAAVWPTDPIAAPFYGCEPGTLPIQLADGRDAVLIRGRSFAPLGRLRAAVRGRPWRSRGVTLGRVLFHLERYGVPAPRLLAFGQRITGVASAEWFALHTPPADPLPPSPDTATAEQLGRCLRLLHDSGCRINGDSLAAFGFAGRAVIRDVTAVLLVKRFTTNDRERDLARLLATLDSTTRLAAEAGYRADARYEVRVREAAPRLTPAEVS
jgi:hypothetical protein